MTIPLVRIVVTLWLVVLPGISQAQEDEIKTPTQTDILVVTVMDQNGKPIEGVAVKPYGCRCGGGAE